MVFITQWDDEIPSDLEYHEDEGLVERAGYMETKDIVEELIIAGQNLQIYREAEYPDGSEIPEEIIAVQPKDKLDALLESRSVNARIRARREAIVSSDKVVDKKEVEEEKKDGNT